MKYWGGGVVCAEMAWKDHAQIVDYDDGNTTLVFPPPFSTCSNGETSLKWLTKPPDDEKMRAVWKGPYIDGQIPADPWNTAYQVVTPGRDGKPFSVYSFGADGKAGGEDINSDIYAQ